MATEIKIQEKVVDGEIVEVKTAQVTESPVIREFTEQQVDSQLKMATQQLARMQAEVDKWTAIKAKF